MNIFKSSKTYKSQMAVKVDICIAYGNVFLRFTWKQWIIREVEPKPNILQNLSMKMELTNMNFMFGNSMKLKKSQFCMNWSIDLFNDRKESYKPKSGGMLNIFVTDKCTTFIHLQKFVTICIAILNWVTDSFFSM